MATPYNYSSAITQPDIMGQLSYFQSLKAQQAQKTAQDRANEAQRLANVQQQKQLDALDTFTSSQRTYDDYMNLGVALGGENIKRLQDAFAGQTDLENQNIITQGGQLMSALRYSPEYALNLVDRQIEAAQNADDKPTLGFYNNLRSMMVKDGKLADAESLQNVEMMLGATLAAVPGAKEMFENLNVRQDVRKKELMTPEEVRKARAEADKAVVDANWAETNVFANLANMGLNLSDQVKDPEIRKQIDALAKLKSEEAKAVSELQREKLGLEIAKMEQAMVDLEAKKADEIRVAKVQAERGSQLIDQIMAIGYRKDLGGITDVFGSATGTFQSGIFTFDQDVADLEEAVKTLQSQVFLSEVGKMRGLGTLTDAEGIRLEQSIRSLSFRQSRDQFVDNLLMIQKLLKKNAEETEKKFGRNVPIPGTPGTVTDVNPQARTVTIGGVTYTVEEEAE